MNRHPSTADPAHSRIVEALLTRGDQVRVLDNFSSGRRDNLVNLLGHIDIVEGDIRDTATVQEAAKGVEMIFHLPATASVPESMRDPPAAEAINAGGSPNLLVAAQKAAAQPLSGSLMIFGSRF